HPTLHSFPTRRSSDLRITPSISRPVDDCGNVDKLWMVPKRGLEPRHPCGHQTLNLARLPIPPLRPRERSHNTFQLCQVKPRRLRSEEHTSELQSRFDL